MNECACVCSRSATPPFTGCAISAIHLLRMNSFFSSSISLSLALPLALSLSRPVLSLCTYIMPFKVDSPEINFYSDNERSVSLDECTPDRLRHLFNQFLLIVSYGRVCACIQATFFGFSLFASHRSPLDRRSMDQVNEFNVTTINKK